MNPSLLAVTSLYALFVIYGSLVPLEFKDVPLDSALVQFKAIPYLNLGAASRADWIANILLYIPLAFGASASFGNLKNHWLRGLLAIAVSVFCIALAVGVEFTQLFFPPRTVSINDLIAETLGTVIGVMGWQFFGDYFSSLYHHLLRGSFLSAKAAIIFYVLVYFALSLFPFDFVTSMAELTIKLTNSHDAWILPFGVCSNEPVRCGVKLLAEMVVMLPLGLLFCAIPYLPHRRTVAILVGFFLGVTIETVQVFLLSGSGQGISVVTRMVGMGAGAQLLIWGQQRGIDTLKPLLRRAVWLALPLYLFLVLSVNGWFAADSLLDKGQALEKLAETHFLPLYYYYFTTESVALVSLISNIGLYFPIGLGCWALFFSGNPKPTKNPPHWFFVGLLASLLALGVETGKLFLADKHADPSDVWLAFLAAAGCYGFLIRLQQWLASDKTPIQAAPAHPEKPQVAGPHKPQISVLPAYTADKRWRIVSCLLWAAIAAALFHYPVAPGLLGLLLIAYTVLLWYFPYCWLIVVPALLPIMDFAPWTGRFFFDEFDLLVLTTLAFYFWQKPQKRIRRLMSLPSLLLLAVFTVFYGVSLFKGVLPWTELNTNSFSNYYSHFNSLRVGKGFFWSLLLLPFLQLTVRRYRHALSYFGLGVLLGLAGVTVFAIFERLVFASLFDFSSDFRISALFSTMHTGGGHIESYLLLSLPFITLLFINPAQHLTSRIAGFALFTGGLYTLLMTYARGGYIGFVMGFVVLLVALLVCFGKQLRPKNALWALPLLLLSVLMALPVLNGSMIQNRFGVIGQDKESRVYHWQDTLAMRDNDLPTTLFGMGLGSFPRTFFLLNTENSYAATYEIAQDKGNNFLRLRGGDSLYFGQYLPIAAHTAYHLVLDVRANTDKLSLSASLCEKSMQFSLRCSPLLTDAQNQAWTHADLTLNSNEVGEPVAGGWLTRPIQLTFYNGNGKGKWLDVDNVQLLDAAGVNILSNGDFTKGSDFWFFAAEKHNPWHIFNFWVALLFDLGWLGASAFLLLFANALYTLARQLPKQNVFASVLLASFSGFMTVGFVDSPFDAPRLTLLFFIMLFLGLMRRPRAFT
ncbi:MAG: VanZ family protein [Methylococcales bacterium]|nr:VanZ family protein [Methylococcales bacterium]